MVRARSLARRDRTQTAQLQTVTAASLDNMKWAIRPRAIMLRWLLSFVGLALPTSLLVLTRYLDDRRSAWRPFMLTWVTAVAVPSVYWLLYLIAKIVFYK